jgi:nitrite reductase (cytochrome c-552)
MSDKLPDTDTARSKKRQTVIIAALVASAAVVSALVTALLVNVFERKQEAKQPYVRVVQVDEETTDPTVWAKNWPQQYDSYKRTAESTRTRFGGHGGSEAMPAQKLERDPWLKRMFAGYAFAIDYRDRRGHAYMLADQEQTERVRQKPQPGACLHCHASIIPTYRKAGGGDVMKGFELVSAMKYQDAHAQLVQDGHAHPVSCVDCHDPSSLALRATRPGFLRGIAALAASSEPVPHLPSIERWRQGDKQTQYDPNVDASRQEMRSFVCGQCHVEYHFAGEHKIVTYPWHNGLKVEQIEAHYDAEQWTDYKQAETGAPILKAQHPEFELWSQGIHARSGVSCADCHMAYQRVGATKVSDHWVRSPLLNINRACQTCHRYPEEEIKARVDVIQTRNFELMQRAGSALMAMMDASSAAKKDGVTESELTEALAMQRKSQWRLDFVAAENSMGFHAPQEAARILAEAIDYARQGEALAQRAHLKRSGASSTAAVAPDAGAAPAHEGAVAK